VWEKWKDPLLSNFDETEWPGYDMDEDGEAVPFHSAERQPIMHTPFGVVSIMNDSLGSKSFDFWILHTNFDIRENIVKAIEQVNGVETLEIYTRYRIRVGFPRSGLFRPRDIMHEIEEAIYDIDRDSQNQLLIGLDTDVAKKVIDARNKIEEKYEYWAIWVVPNGNMEVVSSDKLNEQYQSKLALLQQAHINVGGRLITSENE